MRTIRTKFKKATSTPKGKIIVYSILLVIVAAIAGGILYWSFYKKQIIRQKLESTIREKSKGLYQIRYEKLDLDEVAGYLSLQGLQLEFDSTRFETLDASDDAPPTLLRINIPQLTVAGVKTPRALIDKEIVGRKLEIREPVIEIIYTNAGKYAERNTPTREVYEQILGDLRLIRIDTLLITGASIITRDLNSGRANVQMDGTNVTLVNVAVDSVADADTTRLLFSKEVNVSSKQLSWASADKRYKYSLDSFTLASSNSAVAIKSFRIDPQLDEAGFTRSQKFADDRFDISVNNIAIRQIDFRKLFNEQIIADTIVIGSANVKIYRDLGLPHDGKNRVGTYPNQALEKLNVPLLIRSLAIQTAFIEYKERNQKTRMAGKVQFYNTSALMTNITNRKELAGGNNIMTVDTRSKFLNKAPLRATWKFHLFNPKGRFDLRGSLGAINAQDVNVLTQPMGPARIEKGIINGLDFNFAATDYHMGGTVKMLYEDLKVAVLEKDDDTKDLKKKKLASLAANVIIKNSNPSGNKDEARVIRVEFDRDTRRSLFHMTWKTLFKGIKETAGIKK